MRKRTVNLIVDKIVWGVILLLPILLYVIYLISYEGDFTTFYDFTTFLANTNMFFNYNSLDEIVSMSPVARMFFDIFENGFNGIMGVTGSDFLAWYLMYMIFVEFFHLCVDVILILPRVCRKFFDKLRSE